VIAVVPEAWMGRCVRLEGFVRFNLYFADVAGAYAASSTNDDDRRNDGWLGLYHSPGERLRDRLERSSVIGRVDDCAAGYERAVAEADPDVIIMPTGYCHYRGGLVLVHARTRSRGRAVFERQMGERARLTYGDLETEAEAGPVPAEVRTLGDRFLAALRGRDVGALRSFVGLWSEHEHWNRARWARVFSRWLMGYDGSPLAALRDGPASPQTAYFRERILSVEKEEGASGDWHVCYCKTADCTNLWPISARDATAESSRPYLCLIAFNDRLSSRGPADRLAVVRSGGIREPSQTAFRRQRDSIRR
jgi:hypothetical protein